MRKTKNHEREISQVRNRMYCFSTTLLAVSILVVGVVLTGCTKAYIDYSSTDDELTTAGIEEIFPANSANSVEINPVIGVAFKSGTDPSKVAASSLTLKTGDVVIPGKVAVSGTMAMFTYGDNLSPNTEYTATIQIISTKGSAQDGSFEYSWKFKTGKDHRDNSLSVVSVNPPNLAKDVPVSISLTIKVNKEVKSWMKNLISVALKTGSTPVAGSLSFSGSDITFDPSVNLTPGTVFKCEFIYGIQGQNNDNHDGDNDNENDPDGDHDKGNFGNSYSWSFTTTGSGNTSNIDTSPPTIISVNPVSNSSSVAVNSNVAVTFSEAMNSATITSSTFGLKQGATVISGKVTYTGNIATFAPSASLTGGAAYTATVTTGAQDASGNALAANYSWSFTTAALIDVTPPIVLSVTPALNATSVAVNSNVTATFSEAMNSATITSSTFGLKQGTTVISGTVSYSGNIATFTPSASLTGGAAYTATVTTGAQDASGNALAANYTWNFTTIAAATGLSFAGDIVPVLTLCNVCHTHPWTTSSVASTYYTNLVNGGYVNPTAYTSSTIYTMLNGGHASSMSAADRNKILTWMNEGSKNN
jgi:hypothetical protein